MGEYSDLLKEAIGKSGKSLNQISEGLQASGFATRKGYISKLQNGKIPPATKKLNDKLAEILHIDPLELEVKCWKEKIPTHVLEELKKEEQKPKPNLAEEYVRANYSEDQIREVQEKLPFDRQSDWRYIGTWLRAIEQRENKKMEG